MKKRIWTILRILFGICILLFLIYKVGFTNLINSLVKFNLIFLLPISIVLLISFFIGTLNIKILLKSMGAKINFFKLMKYYLISWSIGLVVPGKIGEFSIAYFLKKEGLEGGPSFIIPLMDKILTFLCVSLIASVGIFFFFGISNAIKLLLGTLVIVAISSILFLSERIRNLIKKYILGKYSNYFNKFSKTLKYMIKNSKKYLVMNIILTFAFWMVTAFVPFFIFKGFGVTVHWFFVLTISTIGTMLSIIPISISGLGVREGVGMLLYSQIAVPREAVLSMYLTVLAIKYLLAEFFILTLKN